MKIILRSLRIGMSPSAKWVAGIDGGIVSKVSPSYSWIDEGDLAKEPYGTGSSQKEALGDFLLNNDVPGVEVAIDSIFLADHERGRRA